MKQHKKHTLEGGSSFLLVIICIAFMLTLCAYSLRYRQLAFSALQAHQHSRMAKKEAISSAVLSIPHYQGITNFYCLHNTASHTTVEIKRSICSLYSISNSNLLKQPTIVGTTLSNKSQFPLIDFETLLSKATNCPRIYTNAPTRLPSGKALSIASSISRHSCKSLTGTISSYRGNLELSVPISIPQSATTLNISASGFVEFSSTLQTTRPLLIVAAGDIHIASLEAYSAVTLVSSTGEIAIDSVLGYPDLKTISWQGSNVPVPFHGDNGLYPPIREIEVLAIRPTKEL